MSVVWFNGCKFGLSGQCYPRKCKIVLKMSENLWLKCPIKRPLMFLLQLRAPSNGWISLQTLATINLEVVKEVCITFSEVSVKNIQNGPLSKLLYLPDQSTSMSVIWFNRCKFGLSSLTAFSLPVCLLSFLPACLPGTNQKEKKCPFWVGTQ